MELGALILGVAGHTLTATEREQLQHPLVGGVILFTRNYDSPEQITALCDEIHALRHPPLLIAVDHEGGRVQRFRRGFTRLPPARRFGTLYDRDPAAALHAAEITGWLMAAELRAVGVDFSYAPVLDLDYGVSTVIGDRAFHHHPHTAGQLALAYTRGMRRAGMAATGKHFPGHGAVEADSHLTMVVDERDYEQLAQADLLPFAQLIAAGLEGIMPAHVVYPRCAPEAAGFSPFWLQEVLRQRLGFQGVIFSDDLEMQGAAAAGDILARAQAAVRAGCDMILCCNDFTAMHTLLDSLNIHVSPATRVRMARLYGQAQPPSRAALQQSPSWHTAYATLQAFNATA